MLSTNNKVLRRGKDPKSVVKELKLDGTINQAFRHYEAYYAVVENNHPPLVHATLVYENDKYHLYHFASDNTLEPMDRTTGREKIF
jgi:hypothetical protein